MTLQPLPCDTYYLDPLSAQHCQFPHVSEGLQQVLVQLGGGLQQTSVGLIFLLIQLQQLDHTVHGLVLLQQLQDMYTQEDHHVIVRQLTILDEMHLLNRQIKAFEWFGGTNLLLANTSSSVNVHSTVSRCFV